jgi:hypothetical protein
MRNYRNRSIRGPKFPHNEAAKLEGIAQAFPKRSKEGRIGPYGPWALVRRPWAQVRRGRHSKRKEGGNVL